MGSSKNPLASIVSESSSMSQEVSIFPRLFFMAISQIEALLT
jgi:hypothetical protein